MRQTIDNFGQAGQYYTPRDICRLLTALAEPEPRHQICDFAAGTAGFLIQVQDELQAHSPRPDRPLSVISYDISPAEARLGIMNLMLHGNRNPVYGIADMLHQKLVPQFDVIISNPPIGVHHRALDGSPLATYGDGAFVGLAQALLESQGRAVLLLPPLFMSGTDHFRRARIELIDNACLRAVIELPSGVLSPYTANPAVAVVFEKSAPATEVFFYRVPADGFGRKNAAAQALRRNHLEVAAQTYLTIARGRKNVVTSGPLSKESQGQWDFIRRQVIIDADYDLSVRRYLPLPNDELPAPEPMTVLHGLINANEALAADLVKLRELLHDL